MEEKDRIALVKLANEKLRSKVDNVTKKASKKRKKPKRKKPKTFALKTGFRQDNDIVEVNPQPRHCFSIYKVMFNGYWYTPLHAWAGVELEDPNSPLYQADQPGSAWQTAYFAQYGVNIPFPKFGPFFISNFGPSPPPLNTNAWQSLMSSSPWPQSYDNMNAFYDWITNEPGNTGNNPMADCDYVTILENGPAYVSATTINPRWPDEPIEAWCLQYHGEHYPGWPQNSPGFNACTDVQGYVATHTLLDAGHNHTVPLPVGPEGCEGNIPPRYDPDKCGEIGDVHPHTGGILFSKPGNGPNPAGSGWYYEVAPTNVNQALDANGNVVSIGPGGTPTNALNDSACGDMLNYTYHTVTTECFPANETPTGLSNAQVYFGYGPGSINPTFDPNQPWFTTGIEVNATTASGNNAFMPFTTSSTVTNAAAYGPVAFPTLSHDTIVVDFADVQTNWPYPCYPIGNHNGAETVTFTEIVSTAYPGFTPTGLEWGINNVNVSPFPTNAFFGSGHKNTLTIDSYTQSAIPPPYHPTLDTRHVAAEEALKYGVVNGHLLAQSEEWFLPSYDEFIEMMAQVGPNASLWTGIVPNTAQQDFIDSWDVNFPTNPMSENVYWTSSENDDNSGGFAVSGTGVALQGLDPNDYAIAVKRLQSAPFFEPLFARRCQPLTVRPIRRYKCIEEELEPEYNFRDTHNIWVPNDGNQGNSGGGEQALTPFVSVYTPGGAGSGYGWQRADGSDDHYHNGLGAVIGMHGYLFSLATTDVMMNATFNNMPFADRYKAYTNVKPEGIATYNNGFTAADANGYNSSGFMVSIWDNQKNFIGKWHYKYSQRGLVRFNRIDYKGYIWDCNDPTLPFTPTPNVNCNPSPTYTTFKEEFPDQVGIKFYEPTHIAGKHPVFRYGGNDEERDKRRWNTYLTPNPGFTGPYSWTPPTPTHPSGLSSGEIPYTNWTHPYMENVFNGWTASYAYIKIECAYTQGIGAQAYNSINGPNTDIDSMNVVCMRNLFKDSYTCANDSGFTATWSPPNPDLNPTTGSLLGVGDESNHMFNNAASGGGGYGWQVGNPPNKGNSAFGDLYGINYRDGRRHELGYYNHNLTGPTHPNLALHPKHWAFIWHAAQAPNSGGINWFNDLHDGYASCYGYRCKWDIGDVGPAGGIIVAVPGMAGDAITPDGVAGMEEDGWYYEMSPINLGEYGKDIVFGAEGSWVPYWNDPFINGAASLNQHGGAKNTSFIYDSPYTPIGSGIAATTLETYSFLNINPPGGPYSPPYNQQNAFILCDQYETFDMYGNRYCDWFLPNIQEMWFACNNLLTAPLSSTGYIEKDLYWTSNEYRAEGPGWPWGGYIGQLYNFSAPGALNNLLPNLTYSMTGGGMMFHPLGVNNPDLDHLNAAYAVNVNEKITGIGGPWNADLFPTTKAAYVVYKMGNYKVRAMRRFKCPEWVDPSANLCWDPVTMTWLPC